MRNTLLVALFLVPLLTSAQTRVGGEYGPAVPKIDSIKVLDFLHEVNLNSSKCPGGQTSFKNLGQFQVSYNLTHSLEMQNKECEANDIPKKFQCLLGGEASVQLRKLTSQDIGNHINVNTLEADTNSNILGFVEDLVEKLSKNEKK